MSLKKSLSKWPKAAVVALLNEIGGLHDKESWHPVRRRDISKKAGIKIIRSSLFFKEKFLPSGAFDKLKARLVADGSMQERALYTDDQTSSPTAALQSVFTVAALAAKERREVVTIDVTGAYLNAVMKTDVYMRLEPTIADVLCNISDEYRAFVEPDGGLVVKLDRALYGCVESGKLWYDTVAALLLSDGFTQNPADKCVFNKTSAAGVQCTVCLYVDDMLCTCIDSAALEAVHALLVRTFGQVSINHGRVHSYLGMTLDFSRAGAVRITMERYVDELLRNFEVEGIADTPASSTLFEIREGVPELGVKDAKDFHSRVATLLFLAKRIRPDIGTAVAFLTTRVQQPTTDDGRKLLRVLRYINGTQHLGLTIVPSEQLCVIAYVDASFAPHADAKSHSGTIITLGQGPVYTESAKQSLTTKSSSESELVALSDSASQVVWTRNFLLGQGYTMGPALVYQDNTSTIIMAEKGAASGKRTRHIGIRFFFIKDRIDSGEIAVQYLPTDEMVADVLTKPLQGAKFLSLRRQLLGED